MIKPLITKSKEIIHEVIDKKEIDLKAHIIPRSKLVKDVAPKILTIRVNYGSTNLMILMKMVEYTL